MRSMSGCLVLQLKVSWSVRFSDAMPKLDLEGMKYLDIINLISTEQLRTLSPTWKRFLSSFSGVLVQAKYIAQVDSHSIIAAAAVAFAVKVVVDQIGRDDKVERLVQIMANLYSYFNEAEQIKVILTYRRTLARLLNQTSESAHFIANYRKVNSFAQRAVIHMVSDADDMINQFEQAFGELKIELIMGSSLQTAVISFQILQKVENIENLMYLSQLQHLNRATTWDSSRCCLRGTRDDDVKDIIQWATNADGRHQNRLYLLTGPPGCGKSSIAHTVARIFYQVKRLGAAVFTHDYNDGDKQVNAKALSSTIAYQLANYNATIRQRMAQLIRRDSHLASADIAQQFPNLIVAAVKDLTMIGPILIVVDGITNEEEQNKLIKVLAEHSFDLPDNFRILLTSRLQRLTSDTAGSTMLHHVHVIDFAYGEGGNLDIGSYMTKSFESLFATRPSLHEEFAMAELENKFVQRACGLHFWATTAYRWLSSCRDGLEVLLIKHILTNRQPLTKEEAMDHLYLAIIQLIPDRVAAYRAFEALAKFGTLPHSLAEADLDLEYPGLIIKVERTSHQKTGSLFRLHPTFEDFLTDPLRCNKAFCVQKNFPIGYSLWELCLDQLNGSLKHNICHLPDPLTLNEEIQDKEEQIRISVPESLQYACRYWMYHLELAGRHLSPAELQVGLGKIHNFLFIHLLHWMEIMSLLGELDLVIPSLRSLVTWLKRRGIAANNGLSSMIREGILFIGSFYSIIVKSAMHSCISALMLMPSDSLLFQTYQEHLPAGLINLASDSQSGWTVINQPAERNVPLNTQYSAFASFRYLIACAETSPNQRVCFYDSRTGRQVGISLPFTNISSMDFSRNGQQIAFAGPGIFGIWDIKTGDCVKTFDAAPNWPSGVIFSGDGALVLGIVNIDPVTYEVLAWDVKTASRLSEFRVECQRNQQYRVPVTLSPDGKMFAGPARDGSGVQFLDIKTAAPPAVSPSDPRSAYTHTGHSNFKGAFWSPDGSLLATMTSSTNQIHIWSVTTQRSQLESELEGTCPGLKWLVFCPDNSCVAALYQDTQLKKDSKCSAAIWDAYSGRRVWSEDLPFERGWVHEWRHCISFLPDGHEIFFFTGSRSRPVRLVNLPGHMAYPPHFYVEQPVITVRYTQLVTDMPPGFVDRVDDEGWIRDEGGKRHLWVPYRNFELSSEVGEEQSDVREEPEELTLQKTTLEVKHPQSKDVMMRFKIDFNLSSRDA
ncbi:hypothetical protein CPB84DRAFT_1843437 [Gymnopilus junonius]|uniref:AAA+ ATPase domain-containing protein n=1 Tax=Gymnopilus junonius TaxID=109634 RepID=A0A9P5NVW8_GYMJU|nr:hypothetical protein CPB84DRAFT_1843437 [Gymnopilus junonius]